MLRHCACRGRGVVVVDNVSDPACKRVFRNQCTVYPRRVIDWLGIDLDTNESEMDGHEPRGHVQRMN